MREIYPQRFAALVVEEFLEQRAADSLREAARELTFDQHRIDRPADVIGQQITLDRYAAGLAIDLDDGNVHTIGIVHVIAVEPALGRKPRRARAAQVRSP